MKYSVGGWARRFSAVRSIRPGEKFLTSPKVEKQGISISIMENVILGVQKPMISKVGDGFSIIHNMVIQKGSTQYLFT